VPQAPLHSESEPHEYVPRGLKIASEWAWRLLLLAALAYVLKKVIGQLHTVLIPFLIAVLLSALLAPAVRFLERRMPRGVAVAIVTITGIALVVGVMTFVVQQVIRGLPGLENNITASFDKIRDWLVNGPANLSPNQIDNAIKAASDALTKNRNALTTGALSTASVVGETVTGMLLTFFSLIFLLKDGKKIWRFTLNFVPDNVRDRLDVAGRLGFASLVSYVRATVMVAFVNATGIGTGLAILSVPLVLPLAALVFMFSFIPIIGGLLSGSVAVLVTLVTKGPIQALIVLGIVIAVQQIEGHVLQPFLTGRAVALHPLAVVLSIAAGSVLGGIFGALMAVPSVAVANTMVRSLHAEAEARHELEREQEPEPEPELSPE
jgi:predicted PurR-regulated permease PerM